MDLLGAFFPLFFLIFLIAIVGLVFGSHQGKKSSPNSYEYQKKPYLCSKAELSFYGVLKQATEPYAEVFVKVRVADVLYPTKGTEKGVWQRAFNAIAAKHFDYVLCDPQDLSIVAAVELDDRSHSSKRAQKRDKFLESAVQSANLPLVRVKAAAAYSISEIRQTILNQLEAKTENAEN